ARGSRVLLVVGNGLRPLAARSGDGLDGPTRTVRAVLVAATRDGENHGDQGGDYEQSLRNVPAQLISSSAMHAALHRGIPPQRSRVPPVGGQPQPRPSTAGVSRSAAPVAWIRVSAPRLRGTRSP